MDGSATGQIVPRRLLVWSAGVSWDAVAGTDRHMATALCEFADVLWVDPPLSPVTPARFAGSARRVPWPNLQPIASNMLRLTPKALPFHSRYAVWRTTWPLVRAQIRWALTKLKRRPHAIIAAHLDNVLGEWGTGVVNVLYGTDDFVSGASLMKLDVDREARQERAQLAKADIAVAVSTELAHRWQPLIGSAPVVVIPNGVNVDAYRAPLQAGNEVTVELPRPIAGVVGQFSPRIDIDLLWSIVEAGCSLLLVGPVDPGWEPKRFSQLVSLARVHWVGRVSFNKVPGYLRSVDVGVTPYADSPFNRAAFPLKTLEYLAAGKPVVSTDLPSVNLLKCDQIFVANCDNFGATVRLVASLANTSELIQRRVEVARQNAWEERARAFARSIGLLNDS